MRTMKVMQPPHRRADARLVRGAAQGLYWQAGDGMVVRVAAREDAARHVPIDAWQLEACAPEGGIVYSDVRDTAKAAQPDARKVGAAGLAMALWMRLFADTA